MPVRYWWVVVVMHAGLKMACNSKTDGYGARGIVIWDSRVVVICIWGTFDLLVLIVILGSFGVLVSKWPATRKRLGVE